MPSPADLIFDMQFPSRLYSELKEGATPDELAVRYGLSRFAMDRRLESARLLAPSITAVNRT